ncbi:E3 ubiquitin-protein ligase RNF182-like, partial [Seriola lalandi dorsalis]
VWLMEDDRHILAVLSCQDRARRGGGGAGGGGEVVLSPTSLTAAAGGGVETSHRSSDCLVITIMELPEESPSSDSLSMLNVVGLYRPPSLDSLPCNLPAQKCHTWTSRSFPRCLLGVLCLVYFSSLPLGIYLLMIGQLWLGVVLVSLVPSTLLLLVLYGFCQCLCHELMEALATRTHTLP